jgi:hypothetical protein
MNLVGNGLFSESRRRGTSQNQGHKDALDKLGQEKHPFLEPETQENMVILPEKLRFCKGFLIHPKFQRFFVTDVW